jgi:hypothetical protein
MQAKVTETPTTIRVQIDKMIQTNGQYLLTIHNRRIVKIQRVGKPDDFVKTKPQS